MRSELTQTVVGWMRYLTPSRLWKRLLDRLMGSKRLYIGWFGGVQIVSEGVEP